MHIHTNTTIQYNNLHASIDLIAISCKVCVHVPTIGSYCEFIVKFVFGRHECWTIEDNGNIPDPPNDGNSCELVFKFDKIWDNWDIVKDV